MDKLRLIAIIKLRLNRGESWINWTKNIIIAVLGVYVLKDFLFSFGLAISNLWYIILPTVYLVGSYILGYLDEKYGVWKLESEYATKELNPFFSEIDNKIDILVANESGGKNGQTN